MPDDLDGIDPTFDYVVDDSSGGVPDNKRHHLLLAHDDEPGQEADTRRDGPAAPGAGDRREPADTAEPDQSTDVRRPVNPYRTDYVYRAIRLIARDNPFYTGFAYFVISMGSIYLLGFVTGDLYGSAGRGISPIYANALDNINLGLVAPVGAALLCNHYNEIRRTWAYLWEGSILAEHDVKELRRLETRVETAYNRRLFVVIALLTAIAINALNYALKTDSWLGVNGGITAVYARVFITANYFMIGLILCKGVVTVWSLQKILGLRLVVQPMHPDRAGGLRPFGSLSLAVFYFLSLITVLCTLLVILDENAKSHLGYYVPVYVLFYVMAPLLLMLSLSKAHRQMASAKEQVMRRLAATFNKHYRIMLQPQPADELDMAIADEIKRVHDIYAIVEKMPVWPLDIRNLSRFVTAVALPVLVLGAELVLQGLLFN